VKNFGPYLLMALALVLAACGGQEMPGPWVCHDGVHAGQVGEAGPLEEPAPALADGGPDAGQGLKVILPGRVVEAQLVGDRLPTLDGGQSPGYTAVP
jgi:hypothetical protein